MTPRPASTTAPSTSRSDSRRIPVEDLVRLRRDLLGFEVRLDVGEGAMRWITVGPAGQPDTAIVLTPPTVDPALSDSERQAITEMMAKGTYAGINLATDDLDDFFEKAQAGGADVVQEPIEQPYGLRDCAFRDPSGNMVRVQQSS